MSNKNVVNNIKQNQKIEIKENITMSKAQQLYQKHIKTMQILEDR